MQLALTLAAAIGLTVFASTCNNPVDTTMMARARTSDAMPTLEDMDGRLDRAVLSDARCLDASPFEQEA